MSLTMTAMATPPSELRSHVSVRVITLVYSSRGSAAPGSLSLSRFSTHGVRRHAIMHDFSPLHLLWQDGVYFSTHAFIASLAPPESAKPTSAGSAGASCA